jgi:hypothetical protein
MKATGFDRFSVPDVGDAEPIETIVARLRKGITSECSGLLRRTRKANAAAPSVGSFRIRLWESRINRIIEANAGTFSIDELRRLRRDCQDLSLEIGRFEA